MEFRVIIPARYASTRLPGKALVDIAGKPMVQHVYEKAMESGAEQVSIATDDKRIADVAESFGAQVCITTPEHQSGTERLAEAVAALECDEDEIVVNVQGDEPLISPGAIRQVAEDLAEHDNVKVASMCEAIVDVEELFDPNVVKVVLNRRNYAMYFSRAPVPWERATFHDKENIKLESNHFRHIGLYAYRVNFLWDYLEWAACSLETMESLEQLRILWNGGRIHMCISKVKFPPGVDTEEDLERVRALIQKKG